MRCRACGKLFSRAEFGDPNTLCPPCRRPGKPMPLERNVYTPPGISEPVVLGENFWKTWKAER